MIQRDPSEKQVKYVEAVRPLGAAADRGAERVLSALAHGAIAFGFLGIGFLVTLAISGIIWLYGRRSGEVRFHSAQAGCYQCSVLLINVAFLVVLAVTGGFSIFRLLRGESDWGAGPGTLIGLLLFAVWFVGSILFGLFAGVMVLLGKRFKYPFIGARFERQQD